MMKIKSKLLSTLAVLLLIATILSLLAVISFADEESAESTGAYSVAELTTLESLRASGILESNTSFYAYTDFDSWTAVKYTGATAETSPVYAPTYAYGGKFVQLVGKSAVTLSSGAVVFNSTDGGYFDVRLADEYSVNYLINAFGGKAFVYQADIKPTSKENKTLFRFETRKRNTAGTSTVTFVLNLLGYDASGNLARYNGTASAVAEYITDDEGNTMSIDKSGFTTLALMVKPEENKYWVMINGVPTNTAGYTLLTESDISSFATLDASVGDDCTFFSSMEEKYFFSDARVNPSYVNDESFLLDNVQLYRIGADKTAADYEAIATPVPKATLGSVSTVETIQKSGMLTSSGAFYTYTGFDNWTKTAYSSADTLTDTAGAIYAPAMAYSGNSIQLAGKSAVNLKDGGVVFNSTDGGYFLMQLGNQYANLPELMLNAYGGEAFVLQADVKTTSAANKMLFRFETKKRKADNSGDATFVINLVGYDAEGNLCRYNSAANAIVEYFTNDAGERVKLDMDSYETVAVLVKPAENKYWVMSNGKSVNTAGYTLITDADNAALVALDTAVGGESTFFSSVAGGAYFPTLARVNASYGEGETFLLDNVQFYRVNGDICFSDYERMITPFKGASVSMEDNVNLNYFLNINSAFVSENPGLTVKFELDDMSSEFDAGELECVVRDFNLDGLDEKYYKAVCEIPPALMSREVRATLLVKDTVIAEHTYSVVEYAKNFVSSSDSATAEAVKTMLNFGSFAQIYYFGANTGNLPNSILESEDRTLTATAGDIALLAQGMQSVGYIEDVTHVASSVTLASDTSINHFFTVPVGDAPQDYKVSCEDAEVSLEMVGERMRLKILGISAQNLDKEYTVVLSKGDASISLTYSVMSYAYQISSSSNKNLVNLVIAMYEYNVAADLYAIRGMHTYERELITPATTESDGVIRYTCAECGYYYEEIAPAVKSLKILGIGNSFTADSMEYLWSICKSAGIETTLGYLYRGGCSLDEHYAYISTDNSGKYVYYKNTDGTWTDTTDLSPSKAIQDEDWDIIVLGQAAIGSGVPSTYAKLNKVINLVNGMKTNKDAKIWFNATWAFQQDVSLTVRPDFAENYGSDQMTMFNAIIGAVELNVTDNPMIAGYVPNTVAIQNLRTSYLGDTLTRDGYHLSHSYGRYTAALMWFKMFTNFELDEVTFVPDATNLDGTSREQIEQARDAIFEAVENAYSTPLEITESTYKTAP